MTEKESSSKCDLIIWNGKYRLLDPYVILPDIDMQKRIVEDVEDRLSVCDSIEQTVDTALQQAEAMRQSILKDAFEGRL